MNIASIDGAVSITMSRRNLEHLLAALDMAESPVKPVLHRMTDKGMLYVFAEENEDHYIDREAGPGFDPFFLPKQLAPPA